MRSMSEGPETVVVQPGGEQAPRPLNDVRVPFVAFMAGVYLVSPYLGLGSRVVDERIAEIWPVGFAGFILMALVWPAGRRVVGGTLVFMVAVSLVTAAAMGMALPEAAWLGVTGAAQPLAMVWLYGRYRQGRSLVPDTPQDVAALLISAAATSLAVGLLGGYPMLSVGQVNEVLLWWALRNTVWCFVGAVMLLILFLSERSTVLHPSPWSNRLGLLTTALLCVFGTYQDPSLPLSWLLIVPCVWGGLTLTLRGTAWLLMVISLIAAGLTYLPQNQFGYDGVLPASSIVDLLVIASATFALILTLLREQRGRLILELDRRAADAESSRELLEAVFDSMSDGVVVLNDRQVRRSNPAARHLVDRLPLPGTQPAEDWVASLGLQTPEAQPVDAALLREALYGRDGTPQDAPGSPVEVVVDHGGESRVLEVSSRQVGREDDPSAVVLLHDVTAQRARLRELSDFAWMVAHDLRGPLTVLDGWLEVLEDRHREYDAAAKTDAVVRAAESSRRMGQVIEDWLAYAVVQHGQLRLERVALASVASDIVANRIAHPVDGERPEFEVDLPHAVRADAGLVRQLLDNVVGNAIKYTPPDRVPEITIRSRLTEDPGWVEVMVADRGVGIPRGQEDAIFEEFHRGEDRGRSASTGLGLALTRRIVALHGGQMRARRNADVGSTFTFTLPVEPDPEPAEPGH